MPAPVVDFRVSELFAGATSVTRNMVHTGGDVVVIVVGYTAASGDSITATFNGVSMTEAATPRFVSTGFTSVATVFRLDASAVTADVVVTCSASRVFGLYCLSVTDLTNIAREASLSAAGSSTGNIALSAVNGTADDVLLGVFYASSGTPSWSAGTGSTSLATQTLSTRGGILTTETSESGRVIDANVTFGTTGNVAALALKLSGAVSGGGSPTPAFGRYGVRGPVR